MKDPTESCSAAAPMHRVVYESLRGEILGGAYGAERAFPSETALSRRFKTGRSTVKRTIYRLRDEGLLVSRQGKGTFVAHARRSRRIGLIVPGVAATDFFKPVVSEINRLARESGYVLRFGEVWSEVREERLVQVRELAAEFIKERFAGVIYEPLAGPLGDETNPAVVSQFAKFKIPVVLLDCDIVPFPERSGCDVVGVNDIEAGARLAKHLVAAGAKNIHFLVCALFPTTFANRLAGAEAELRLCGRRMPRGGNVLRAEADDLKALKRYLKRQTSRPDAFVCSNDAIAAVFKQTLERAGLRVPQDVLLTGFADLPVASLMTPPLTTVRQNREQMARAAFRRLMERIKDPALPPCDIFLPSPIVARESTKRTVERKPAERRSA